MRKGLKKDTILSTRVPRRSTVHISSLWLTVCDINSRAGRHAYQSHSILLGIMCFFWVLKRCASKVNSTLILIFNIDHRWTHYLCPFHHKLKTAIYPIVLTEILCFRSTSNRYHVGQNKGNKYLCKQWLYFSRFVLQFLTLRFMMCI